MGVLNNKRDTIGPAPKDLSVGAESASRLSGESCSVTFHDNVARIWDAKYATGGFRRRAEFFKRGMMPSITKSGRWLDAGCGSGFFSRLLAAGGLEVTGVDASAAMIEAAMECARKAALRVVPTFHVIDNVDRLPFADASFSGCICLSVIEYLDRPFQCLDELTRVLEPGGTLVLSVPHSYSPVRWAQELVAASPSRLYSSKLRYRSLSKFSTTPQALVESLTRRDLSLQKIVGFDVAIPGFLHSWLPPSLIFVIAAKSEL